MYSLEQSYINSLTFTPQQLALINAIAIYNGKEELYFQQTPQALETLREVALIESSESSNRIEGITAPLHRIKAIVLKDAKPQNRSEEEIAGYRNALSLIHESHQDIPFSINVILQLHQMLYRYHPGKGGHWKITDNNIIEKNLDGTVKRVRFTPSSALVTPQMMEDLVTSYKKANELQYTPLVIIPLTILDFLCIHPFSDGNGRSSRLITLLLLYHFGYKVGHYISLERIFEESKETYYEALEASSIGWHEQKHDIRPWLNYFWGALLSAYRELEDRVGLVKGKGFKSEQVNIVIEKKIGEFGILDIEKDCPGIGRDTIRKVLRKLRDEGKIKSSGTGRSAKWIKT